MWILSVVSRFFMGLPAVKWAFKNAGLAIGVIELILEFVVSVLIQLSKLAIGLCNIFETDRSKDEAVNWIANAEAFVAVIEKKFTEWKGKAYRLGVKNPRASDGPA